jgi:flagellar biosynthesis/type III secretory pathway protein FliH
MRGYGKFVDAEEGAKMAASLAELWVEEGMAKGEAKGRAEGEAKGKAEGEAKGRAKSRAEDIIKLLTLRFGLLPKETRDKLAGYSDLIYLDSLFTVAVTCKSLDEFKGELA